MQLWMFICSIVSIVALGSDTSGNSSDCSRARNLSDGKQDINIVVYDSIKGYLNWAQDWFTNAALEKCSTRCRLIDDKSQIAKADVVIYHAPTHSQIARSDNQPLKVLISLEQPKYAKILSNPTALRNFDLIATYSLQPKYPNTDIPNLPLTYYPLHILSTDVVLQRPRPFSEKTGYGTGMNMSNDDNNCIDNGLSYSHTQVDCLILF